MRSIPAEKVRSRIMFKMLSRTGTNHETFETQVFLHAMTNIGRKYYSENPVYYEPGLFEFEKVKRKSKRK